MILVMVGSSEQPFTRLLRAMDELAPRLGEPVVMQSGRIMRQTLKDGEHRWGATIDTPREPYYHASALVGEGAAGEACAAR